MGEFDYKKWANNWDPCVDTKKVKPKVDSNVQTALQLTLKEKEMKKALSQTEKKKKRLKSARPRDTYLDRQLGNLKKRLPSKEEVYRTTFHAENRYRFVEDQHSEHLHKQLQFKSNTDLLKEKIYNRDVKNAKANQLMKAKEYSQRVRVHNQAKVEEQRREGKRPGLYTENLKEEQQRQKSTPH